jgi:hypothetical protein
VADRDELRARCQVLYDVAGSLVLSDTEWAELINDSYRKLWRTVVRINKSFRTITDPFTLTAGLNARPLPANYRETLMVRKDPGTENQVILPRLTPRVAASRFERSYRLQNTNLLIEPLARCEGTYDHIYIPNVTILSAGDTELDAELDQFAAFIVYDAVNVALAREETARLYEVDFQREERDVIAWASSQRSADPDTIEDVRGRQRWGWGAP